MSNEQPETLPIASIYVRLPIGCSTLYGLSVVTKAIAAYLRTLVDLRHGWLPLLGEGAASAFRHVGTRACTRAERKMFMVCIERLLSSGYLVRCRQVDAELGAFVTSYEREIYLSNWAEDPQGDWVVIADWVPDQMGMGPKDRHAWHKARRERIAAITAPDTINKPLASL